MEKLLYANESVEEFLCYQVYKFPQQCFLCQKTQEQHLIEFNQRLHIHHIDKDHRNVSNDNLKPLCNTCHMRITHLKPKILWRCIICNKEKLLSPSEAKKRKFCSYACSNPNKKNWKKNQTKETNSKVIIAALKCSAALKEKYKSGELEVWSKSLTKEMDERIRISAEKGSKTQKLNFLMGVQHPWNYNLTKEQTSEIMKLRGKRQSITKKELLNKGQLNIFPLAKYMANHPEKRIRKKICIQCNEEFIGHFNQKKCNICRESRKRLRTC